MVIPAGVLLVWRLARCDASGPRGIRTVLFVLPGTSFRQFASFRKESPVNPADMIRLLDSIAQDRNIDRNLLLQDLEEAMKSAARKHFNSLDVEEFGCRVDPMTGEITMWRNVYDDIDDPEAQVRPEPIALEDLGRICLLYTSPSPRDS